MASTESRFKLWTVEKIQFRVQYLLTTALRINSRMDRSSNPQVKFVRFGKGTRKNTGGSRRVFIRKFCIKNDLGICLNGLANKEYRITGIIEQSGILSWGEDPYETSPAWILLRFLVITGVGSSAYFQRSFCGVQISIFSAFAQDGILGWSSVIRSIICSI